MSCFGKKNKYRHDEETTVVYKIEALDETEAAFLPHDLPEVVLDGSHMTTDTRTLIEEHAHSLKNGSIRPSNYSEVGYSPQIQIMPMAPVRKKTGGSTLNRATSLESIHILQNPRRQKRAAGPNYIPVNGQTRYGNEYAVSTYSQPIQVRRQYLVPYKPVYIKPQAYHHSLPRPLTARPLNTRIYRQSSNAESYTLSRPPGRAQPIRVLQQQQPYQPYQQYQQQQQVEKEPILTRKLEDFSKLNLMNSFENQSNTFPRQQQTLSSFQTEPAAEEEFVIEAALEPPKFSRSSGKTHVKDIVYANPRDVASAKAASRAAAAASGSSAAPGGVDIFPVQTEEGAIDSEDWEESSLYVRRPSLEDVRRVRPSHTAENNQSRAAVRQTAMTTTAAPSNGYSSHRNHSSSSRTHSYGQTITDYNSHSHHHHHQQQQHHHEQQQHHNSLPSPSGGYGRHSDLGYGQGHHRQGQGYMIRTTIPRDPPPRQQSVPMIMVNDAAMQF